MHTLCLLSYEKNSNHSNSTNPERKKTITTLVHGYRYSEGTFFFLWETINTTVALANVSTGSIFRTEEWKFRKTSNSCFLFSCVCFPTIAIGCNYFLFFSFKSNDLDRTPRGNEKPTMLPTIQRLIVEFNNHLNFSTQIDSGKFNVIMYRLLGGLFRAEPRLQRCSETPDEEDDPCGLLKHDHSTR